MSRTPRAEPSHEAESAPLNPSLKQVRDESYGPDHEGRDPMDSVSVKKDEGAVWPMIWAVVTILCVLITIVLLVG